MKITINELRQKVADNERDIWRDLTDVIRRPTHTVHRELTGGNEELISEKIDFMGGLEKAIAAVDGVDKAKAALANFNATHMIEIDGAKMSVQEALTRAQDIRKLMSFMDRHDSATEIKRRKNDGPNTASYYEITRPNFNPDDLRAMMDKLRDTASKLSAMIDKANMTEIDWE